MVFIKEFNVVGKVKTEKCFIYYLMAIDYLSKGEGKQTGKVFAPLSSDFEIGETVKCIAVNNNLELVNAD